MELTFSRIVLLWGFAFLSLVISFIFLRKSKKGIWIFLLLAFCYVILNSIHWNNLAAASKIAGRFDVTKNVEYLILANVEALVLLIIAFLSGRYLKTSG